MILNRLNLELENLFRKEILKVKQYDWDEDFITRRILCIIRDYLQNKTIEDLYHTSSIDMNVFKAQGSLETRFGDIAFIIQISYRDRKTITGVGFVEAKRRYKISGNFDALDPDQLARLIAKSPYSILLLYDYEPILLNNLPIGSYTRLPHTLPYTYTASTMINTALQLNSNTRELYRICIPFVYQLTHRYFYGLDLNFSRDILDYARGYSENMGYPEYVVTLEISDEVNNEKKESISVNTNRYTLI